MIRDGERVNLYCPHCPAGVHSGTHPTNYYIARLKAEQEREKCRTRTDVKAYQANAAHMQRELEEADTQEIPRQ